MRQVFLWSGFFLLLCFPLFAADDLQMVLDKAERVLATDPNNDKARYNRGWALSLLGKHAEAERDFRAVIAHAKDESKVDSLFNLGYTLFMQKNLQGALEAWKAGLRLAPHDKDMQYNYTVARRMLQEQKEKNDNKNDDKKDNKKQDTKDKEQKPASPAEQNKPEKKPSSPEAGTQQKQQGTAGSMSSREALRLLKALQEQERKANPEEKQLLGGPRRGKDW